METTRRGFMGLLAGAVLGKIIGPKLIASPTPEAWKAAAVASRTPVESFLSLEVISARVLEVIERELKWLRMSHVNAEQWGPTRIGGTVHYRGPQYFDPQRFDLYQPCAITERLTPVTINRLVSAHLPLENSHIHSPFGRFSDQCIEPLGVSMAERIIQSVRSGGGANLLVTANPDIPPGLERAIIARLPNNTLSLRAIQAPHVVPQRDPETGELLSLDFQGRILRFDMVYGTGIIES